MEVITQEILNPGRILETLNTVSTAEEALLYLHQAAPFRQVVKPDLIFLDINLPKSSGFTVLYEVKTNPELIDIPVIILTSSTNESDRNYALKNGADDYMEKPLEIELLRGFLKNRLIKVKST
jgi:two-component system response regulator